MYLWYWPGLLKGYLKWQAISLKGWNTEWLWITIVSWWITCWLPSQYLNNQIIEIGISEYVLTCVIVYGNQLLSNPVAIIICEIMFKGKNCDLKYTYNTLFLVYMFKLPQPCRKVALRLLQCTDKVEVLMRLLQWPYS